MKLKTPPMPEGETPTVVTLRRFFEARDAQWLEMVGPVVESLRECLKKGSRWHPCDPVVFFANEALRNITED